ncbi:MAG: hypothetical protein ACE5H0_12770 [Bacteroidota bacterium]
MNWLRPYVFVLTLHLLACGDIVEQPPPPKIPKPEYDHPCLEDVVSAFEAVPSDGERLAFWSGDVDDQSGPIPWPRYTNTASNSLGFNNHFQGVQRLRNSSYLAVTGSDVHSGVAHLFLVHLASRSAIGRWGSNLVFATHPKNPSETVEQPIPGDMVVTRVDLDTVLWHAGGLSTLGHLLAIPIDHGDDRSKVVFYDASDPTNLNRLQPTIERAASRAAAVAVTRLPDGRYLAAVRSSTEYDFYVSRSDDFLDGFDSDSFVRWDRGGVLPELRATSNLQNINFLNQCDGSLFMIGFRHTSPAAPTLPGQNVAYLFKVVFPDGDYSQVPDIEQVGRKVMSCSDSQCNFDAAAGAFITDDAELLVYGAAHYRHPLLDDVNPQPTVVRFKEF